MTPKQLSYLLSLCPQIKPHISGVSASQAHALITVLEKYHAGGWNVPQTFEALRTVLGSKDIGDMTLPIPRGAKPQPAAQAPLPTDPATATTLSLDPATLAEIIATAQAPALAICTLEAKRALADLAAAALAPGIAGMIETAVAEAIAAQPAPAATVAQPQKATGYVKPSYWDEASLILGSGLNLCLSGPAGSGKSRYAREYAAAHDMAYQYVSFSGGLSLTQLIGGYQLTHDEHGKRVSKYVPTAFIQGLSAPGVTALEELMAADPETALWLNAALDVDTRTAATPDGAVTIHPEHRFVALSNGTGRSESRAYAAVQRQDESLLNRFQHLRAGYETAVDKATLKPLGKDLSSKVRAILTSTRSALDAAGILLDLGPRQCVAITRLIGAGMDARRAVEIALIGNLSEAERRRAGIAPHTWTI